MITNTTGFKLVFFRNRCVLVLWMIVALALGGLISRLTDVKARDTESFDLDV